MSDYDVSKVRHFDSSYFQQPKRAGWVSAPPPPPAPAPAPTPPEEFKRRHGHNDTHPDHLDDKEYTAEHHYKRHHEPPQSAEAEARAYEFGKAYYDVRKQVADIAKATYEPPPKMVYNANIAEASYAFYYKNEEKMAEIEETTGLKIDPELSDRFSVVLHDNEGNAYISYRGTDPKNAQDLAEDVRIFGSRTIKNGEGMTPRLLSAEAKYLATASKYNKVAGVMGHSLGGHQSLFIAEKFGIEGFHFSPAVSYEQAFKQGGISKVKQVIVRTPDDPVSLWALIASAKNKLTGKVLNPNRVVHHTPLTAKGVSSHSLSNATEAKTGKFSATAVEEATTGAKALKGAKATAKRGGELLSVAFAGYVMGEDIKEGKSAGETTRDVFETIIPVEGDEFEGKVRRYRMEQEQKKRDDEAYEQSKGFEERMNAKYNDRVRNAPVPNDAPKEARHHPDRWVAGTHNGKKGGWLGGKFYADGGV